MQKCVYNGLAQYGFYPEGVFVMNEGLYELAKKDYAAVKKLMPDRSTDEYFLSINCWKKWMQRWLSVAGKDKKK